MPIPDAATLTTDCEFEKNSNLNNKYIKIRWILLSKKLRKQLLIIFPF